MADDVLQLVPDPNLVRVWVTPVIERDYVARGVFPSLRNSMAQEFKNGTGLHYVTLREAAVVEFDAKRRRVEVRAGLAHAFKALLDNLGQDIIASMTRPTKLSGATPFKREDGYRCEILFGTKAQLQAVGIGVGEPFPGEPDGGERALHVRDERGYRVVISRAHYVWPGVFRASVKPPDAAPARSVQSNDEPAPTVDAKSFPKTHEEYREAMAWKFRQILVSLKDWWLVDTGKTGFRYDDEALSEFDDLVEELFGALNNGGTICSVAHRRKVQAAEMLKAAKADAPLQAFLARVRTGGASHG
jgi:hypothetical protein